MESYYEYSQDEDEWIDNTDFWKDLEKWAKVVIDTTMLRIESRAGMKYLCTNFLCGTIEKLLTTNGTVANYIFGTKSSVILSNVRDFKLNIVEIPSVLEPLFWMYCDGNTLDTTHTTLVKAFINNTSRVLVLINEIWMTNTNGTRNEGYRIRAESRQGLYTLTKKFDRDSNGVTCNFQLHSETFVGGQNLVIQGRYDDVDHDPRRDHIRPISVEESQ